MMSGFFGNWGATPYGWAWLAAIMPIFIIWGLFWKGFALWRAAQNKQGWWFLILLVINTMGILEIVYLFAVDGGKFWADLKSKWHKHTQKSEHHEHNHEGHEHHRES